MGTLRSVSVERSKVTLISTETMNMILFCPSRPDKSDTFACAMLNKNDIISRRAYIFFVLFQSEKQIRFEFTFVEGQSCPLVYIEKQE